MLQIRLNNGGLSSSDGGGGAASSGGATLAKSASVTAEIVTVACPDHLVIADLPVAKILGTLPSPTASVTFKPVGRKSRRQLEERVLFCVCCDFPIAIYGRLLPCEHAFCLTCARSDSSCYICDERIQKIQTIKMMESIFICGAPHCLKSFLKSSDFEIHVLEAHNDLLSKMERGTHELDNVNITRPSSADSFARQFSHQESSRAPPRPGFSPSSNSQLHDRDDRGRHNRSREQTPMRPPLQQMPIPFQGQQHLLSADLQPGSIPPQGVWFQQPHGFENQSGPRYRLDPDQPLPEKYLGASQESPLPDFPPPLPLQLQNFSVPVIISQGMNLPPFNYLPFPADGSQQYFSAMSEVRRPEMAPDSGRDQVSALSFPHAISGVAGFPDNYPCQWNNNPGVNMQFEHAPVPANQVNLEVNMNPTDSRGRAAVVLAPHSMPPHLHISLPPQPPLPGQGYGWQTDNSHAKFGN